MACKLTVVVGDPSCDFKGAANDQVTLTLVPTSGSALFHDAFYAGKSLITVPSQEIAFTLESGVKDLSVLYTLSPNSTAELHEKCVGNTLLDDEISALNNAKLYAVCGGSANAGGSPIAAIAAVKKAVKKATPKKKVR